MVYLAAPRFLLNSFKLLKVENLASTSCATAAAPEVLFCVAQYDEQKFLGRTNQMKRATMYVLVLVKLSYSEAVYT